MAIALDTSTTSNGASGGGSSLTLSYTMGSVSNGILIVYVTSDIGSDSITGITYNSVSMTQAIKLHDTSNNSWNYLYYLLSPSSGANNIVVSSSSSGFFYCQAASYSGVKQSSQPDATTSGFSATGTSITGNVTTIADNCWGLCGIRSHVGNVSSGTNFNIRASANSIQIGDTNAPKTPAGSLSMTGTFSNGGNSLVMMTFSPSTDTVAGRKTLLGVGI